MEILCALVNIFLCFSPNVEIIGTLLKNACYNRDSMFVIEMIKTLEREELKPNKNFIQHLDEFYKFGTTITNKQKNEGGVKNVKLENFDKFVKFYEKWKKKATVEEEPAPWLQFEDVHYEPEDLKLINKGRAKFAVNKF